jgi:hypothetical protein
VRKELDLISGDILRLGGHVPVAYEFSDTYTLPHLETLAEEAEVIRKHVSISSEEHQTKNEKRKKEALISLILGRDEKIRKNEKNFGMDIEFLLNGDIVKILKNKRELSRLFCDLSLQQQEKHLNQSEKTTRKNRKQYKNHLLFLVATPLSNSLNVKLVFT